MCAHADVHSHDVGCWEAQLVPRADAAAWEGGVGARVQPAEQPGDHPSSHLVA